MLPFRSRRAGVSVSATPTACWPSRTSGRTATAVSVTPPDGETWIQTTTLEGNHDYDAWIMEGDTGYDTTFTSGASAVPLPIFGYVQPTHATAMR